MLRLLPLSLVLALTACQSPSKNTATETAAPVAQTQPLPRTLEEAVANPARDAKNRERDVYRHPLETLRFFGVQPGMTVIEISPGTGWYAEILAPLLATEGRYVAAVAPAGDNEYLKGMNAKFTGWLNSRPEVAQKATVVDFTLPQPKDLVEPGTADLVLTFRNVHNWASRGSEKAAFAAFFKALKPGGKLGVVEHRENPKKKQDPLAKNGYVREADVIRLAESAGFKLEEKSEINANPKDTKDHPEGVWTLPPTLRLGDKDRDKYLAIGESDRMTLRFVKPTKAK